MAANLYLQEKKPILLLEVFQRPGTAHNKEFCFAAAAPRSVTVY